MASCSYLPHRNKNEWENKKKLFEKCPDRITDFNALFYKNRSKFFYRIEKLHKKEADEFLKVYDNLRQLILNLENILPFDLPLLKTRTKGRVEYTRKEVALLFLLSFFDLIDVTQENYRKTNNFRVFQIIECSYEPAFEFGRCFLNYLTIIGKWLSENNPILEEKIVFMRDTIPYDEKNYKKETKLCDIKIYKKGSLFKGDASYTVDFANMYIGGGVLEGGCVQEEILFATETEAIVSMFFMEVMGKDDAIRIDNTIQYSDYTGYGTEFEFKKSAINLKDLSKIKKNKFIAIDASVAYNSKYRLIYADDIKRDIHKAYVGFNLVNFKNEIEKKEKFEKEKADINLLNNIQIKSDTKVEEKSIATGNWGCGAFAGDFELKFLEQWVAASFSGIERLDYYTFNAEEMKFVDKYLDIIKTKYLTADKLFQDLITNKLTQGDVLKILLEDEITNNKGSKNYFDIFKCFY